MSSFAAYRDSEAGMRGMLCQTELSEKPQRPSRARTNALLDENADCGRERPKRCPVTICSGIQGLKVH